MSIKLELHCWQTLLVEHFLQKGIIQFEGRQIPWKVEYPTEQFRHAPVVLLHIRQLGMHVLLPVLFVLLLPLELNDSD